MLYGQSYAHNRRRQLFPASAEASATDLSGLSGNAASPDVHLWAGAAGNVVNGSNRVTTAENLGSETDYTGGATTGPFAVTDAAGRAAWDFEGDEWLEDDGVVSADPRACSVFFVGYPLDGPFCHMGNANLAGDAFSDQRVNGNTPYLTGANKFSYNNTNPEYFVNGLQLQVWGSGGRSSEFHNIANGYRQNQTATFANTDTPFRVGARNTTQGVMRLIEFVKYDVELTASEMDEVEAALRAHYGISVITNQLVVDGDSLKDTFGVTAFEQVAARIGLGETAVALPAGWRVVDMSASGSRVPDLEARRDATNSVYENLLSGINRVVFEIGPNDITSTEDADYGGTSTNTQARRDHIIETSIPGLINTTSVGYLQRGWEVAVLENICAANSVVMDYVDDARVGLPASTFLDNCDANTGDTFEGEVTVYDYWNFTYGSDTPFDLQADASDTTYFQGDGLHPNALGHLVEAESIMENIFGA